MSVSRRWNVSIAVQIWAMVVACLALLTTLIVVNSRAELSNAKTVTSNDLYKRGAATAAALSASYAENVADPKLTQLATEQPSIGVFGAPCTDALERLQQGVLTGYLVVVDARGNVPCASQPQFRDARTRPFGAVQNLLTRIAHRKPGADAFSDPYDERSSVWTEAPLPGHRAAPVSLVYIEASQAALMPQDRDQSIESMVVDDRTNTILMRWPGHNDAVGEAILSEGLLAALTSNGPTSAVGIDGVRRTYRQVLIKGTYFHLLVGLSDKDAYAVARQSLRRNLIFGGLLILVVGLLGLLLHRRISRPARRLRRAIDRFREDDQAPPAPETGPTELAQVAAAFNTTVEARRRADGRFRAIVHNTSDLVIVLDAAGVVTFSGPTAVNLGVTEGMSAVELLDLVHPDDRERTLATCVGWFGSTSTGGRYEMRLGATDEDLRYLDLGAQNLLDDPAVRGVVVTGHDVSERKHFEQHLARQARHDPLTGLANRTAVIEQLARLTYGAEATPAAVLFIDLDRFKLINDSHGHRVGDQLLVALGQELERAVRPGDTVGRFGGDEFVIVAANIDDERTAGEVAQRVQDALCVPIVVEDRELFVSGSIGIALTSHDESPEALLRNADTAMYRAKEGGRNGYALFDDAMREAAVQQLQLENGLHRALERDELVLHYQPIVALADGTLSGVEALLRWQHPEHGLVAPSEFIPVAEETGLIVPIGEWVLREAASWAAVVAERAGHPVRVSVNVSARQLTQPDFLAVVDDVLVTTGLAPHLLCLEVTESLLVQDAHTATETFTALRTLGVRVSIDDFGTGYSSMSYLQQFAVDELKIDRSFINALGTDQTAGTIVGSIVGMAHAMGLEVTAEGVEGDQQLAFLRTIGCEHAQGYFFARPCVPEELEQTIAQTAQWCASAHEAV